MLRPAITFVILASGLKYVGVGTTALGRTLCVVLLLVGSIWLVSVRPWDKEVRPLAPGTDGETVAAAEPGGPD